VILVLGDDEDLFGTSALFCKRLVVIAPLPAVEETAGNARVKAYETMASLLRNKDIYFQGYKVDAQFATILRLVRNVRESVVDALAIMMSQTAEDNKRFKATDWINADLRTPCLMVHVHAHTYTITAIPNFPKRTQTVLA
jgi:hypothetical protein